MTEDSMPLADQLTKSGDDGFLRNVAESGLPLLMEGQIGASPRGWPIDL